MPGQEEEIEASGKDGKIGTGKGPRRPIMALLELLGRKWALRVLWELQGGPLTFRPLQAACGGLSPTVLNRRLSELRRAGVVELEKGRGYALTIEGRALGRALLSLTGWANRWAGRLEDV